MENIINKRELPYAVYRGLIGLLFCFLVFIGRLGNPHNRLDNVTAVIVAMVTAILLSFLFPEGIEAGKWLFYLLDVSAALIGFHLTGMADSFFIFAFPLLSFFSGLRFERKTSLFITLALAAWIIIAVGMISGPEKLYQAAFWGELCLLSQIIPFRSSIGSGERKFKMLYTSLEAENTQLHAKITAMEKKMDSSSIIDPVTGLKNFKYFRLRIDEEIKRARRHNYSFSVCIMEVDGLDKYKQLHGVDEWKKLMLKVSVRLQDLVRDTDLLGRYEGNQFLALFPQTDSRSSLTPVMRIRETMKRVGMVAEGGENVTMSFGVSTYPSDVKEVGGLLGLASSALKRSQSKGTGMITLAVSLFKK